MYDLSVLIPANNEMFLSHTVENILRNIRGNTEVIVVMDGYWDSIPDAPNVTVIHLPKSVGQRAAQNQACRLSTAKYVMKIDAHCLVDEGFDLKMMAEMKDDYTMVPTMYNLHAFDWLCPEGHRIYQGPTPKGCLQCGKPMVRDIIMEPRWSRKSSFYRFDKTLHFQYYGALADRPASKYGAITGYKLSFDFESIPSSVIVALTDFARSHHFICSGNCPWFGKNMPIDTVTFPSIDTSGSIGTPQVFRIGDKLEMNGVAATSVLTEMIDDQNFTASSVRDWFNEPCENKSMGKCFSSKVGTTSISSFIDSADPVPAAGSTINSEFIKELNYILGGNFIYSEKTNLFHNGSVTLSPVHDKEIAETLSIQGSCFMLTREKYWEWNICDEQTFSSWGQQGVEVALKTWLNSGQVMANKKTWYAHMFRTQGGDFTFPYSNPQSKIDINREISRKMFIDGEYKAKYDLNWLLEKFRPVPDWHFQVQKKDKKSKQVIYYTNGNVRHQIRTAVQKQIKKGMKEKHVISVSLSPIVFGENIVLDEASGYLTMAKQILAGIEKSTAEVLYFCEHDVLYHPSHFDFVPPREDVVYYNTNVWRVRESDGHALYVNKLQQLSGLVAYRSALLTHYKKRVRLLEDFLKENNDQVAFGQYVRKMGFEPGTHGRPERVDDLSADSYQSEYPNLDIRHEMNLTPSRWKKEQFRNPRFTDGWTESDEIPGWGKIKDNVASILASV